MKPNPRLSDVSLDSHEPTERIGPAEIELIRVLHPSTDGFVAFAVGDEDGLFPRLAVRSDTLPERVPQFTRDSYVSINQGFRLKQRKGSKDASSGEPIHRTDTLRYLCAAYADLDFYNLGLTDRDVVSQLAALHQQSVISGPSLLVHSGRGIWVLWLLRDENDPDHPPRTRKSGLELKQHREIQAALHKRLAQLGSDKNASNPVRYIRMPGSLNTKSGTVVAWDIQLDDKYEMRLYTVSGLSEQLGTQSATTISEPKHQGNGGAPDNPVGLKRGQAGWQALRARRFSDFLELWKVRGSFRTGCRNNAVFYYSILLAQWGIPIQKAKTAAEQLNAACRPPLKQTTVHFTVRSAYSHKYKKLYDQTIADWLDITPTEASSLQCNVTATRFNLEKDNPAPKPKRIDEDTARITGRQAAILQIISEGKGLVPSSRKMAAQLRARGLTVEHVTVSTDYKALGLKTKQCEGEIQ